MHNIPSMVGILRLLRAELGYLIGDPMWAAHCEVSKTSLKKWHRHLEAVINSLQSAAPVLARLHPIEGERTDEVMVQALPEMRLRFQQAMKIDSSQWREAAGNYGADEELNGAWHGWQLAQHHASTASKEAVNWTPTPENINALPPGVRSYIHDLETMADPAGIVRENHCLREDNSEFERLNAARKEAVTLSDDERLSINACISYLLPAARTFADTGGHSEGGAYKHARCIQALRRILERDASKAEPPPATRLVEFVSSDYYASENLHLRAPASWIIAEKHKEYLNKCRLAGTGSGRLIADGDTKPTYVEFSEWLISQGASKATPEDYETYVEGS